MAANNFFAAYPPQAAPGGAPPPAGPPPPQATGYPPGPPGPPGQPTGPPPPQPTAYQPAPPPAGVPVQPAAVAYASQPAAPPGQYRPPPPNAQAVVASYSAYQPQQQPPGVTYAAPATVQAAASYPSTTYSQYPPPTAQQAVQAAPPPQNVYDAANKSVAQAAAAYYPAVTVSYAVTDHYQARPVYSTTANLVARPAIITGPRPSYTTYAQSTPTSSYSYGAPPVANPAGPKPNLYVQNQPAPSMNLTQVAGPGMNKPQSWRQGPKPTGATQIIGTSQRPNFKPRPPPKPQQLHYCEVCKISCAGPQTYKEHLEGQKHKKKEAALKTGTPGPTTRGGNALRCELCDVTCTGSDAYAAHIRGAKHQKVVKLHTKLGKPIPSVDPVVVSKGQEGNDSEQGGPQPPQGNPIQTVVQKAPQSYNTTAVSNNTPKAPSIPKITFVGAGQTAANKEPHKETSSNNKNSSSNSNGSASSSAVEVTIPRLPEEKDVQPVGHDYIEEIKGEGDKVISFNCRLCECRFNDPNAKEMHMKGRRHRLQYKKKVNPDLVVDIKPSLRQRKMAEERAKRVQAREEFWRRREEEFRMMEEEERTYWEERRRFEEEQVDYYDWYNRGRPHGPRFGPPPPGPMFGYPPMLRRPDTVDDRHVVAKHSEIYPSEDALQEIQKTVSNIEKALKHVSDLMVEETTTQSEGDAPDAKKAKEDDEEKDEAPEKRVKKEDPSEDASAPSGGEKDKPGQTRILKGVMRVGVLAKGLLLKGDSRVRLVVLCGQKPTLSILNTIADHLPAQLESLAIGVDEEYTVKKEEVKAGLVVEKKGGDFPVSVVVSLTSPLMREEGSGPNPENILNPDQCLEALAALRHAKWFQARAAGRQSCVIIIRILRDFCQRVPTWSPFNLFAIELLVEKVLFSAQIPLSPGDALRRVFEALSGGILLLDSPGFLDPCEKEPSDAAKDLNSQQRGDITASAQHALRLIAFRQIHKVLGIEALPPPKFGRGRFARKRRREDGDNTEAGEANEKKDKKEQEEEERENSAGGGAAAGAEVGGGEDVKAGDAGAKEEN